MLSATNIQLVQFKNYVKAQFNFYENVVAICGANGSGKTNLLDSLYYACFTRSYFAKNDAQNIAAG
jgi:DNA replication and repair protein RecF